MFCKFKNGRLFKNCCAGAYLAVAFGMGITASFLIPQSVLLFLSALIITALGIAVIKK